MMQKNLYYLILIVGFVVIFGIDVFIIAFYNLNLRYAVPLGVVFVITVFRLFKTGMKYIMFSNGKHNNQFTNDSLEQNVYEENNIDASADVDCANGEVSSNEYLKLIAFGVNREALWPNCFLVLFYILVISSLCLGVHVLRNDNPRRIKYMELEKEYQYEPDAKLYLKLPWYFQDKSLIEPKDELGSSFGTFISAFQGKCSAVEGYKVDKYIQHKYWDRGHLYNGYWSWDWKEFRYAYNDNLSIYKIDIDGIEENDLACNLCASLIGNYLDSLDIKYSALKNKNGSACLFHIHL